MESTDELPLHAPVRIVCRECLPSNEYLPHVVSRIDELLDDFPGQKAFNAACQRGASAPSLEYLLGRSFPNWKTAICLAAQSGHLQTLQWMAAKREDRRGPWKNDFRKALCHAAAQGHLETVIWLFRNFSSDDPLSALCGAASNGHLPVVQWLHEHGVDDTSFRAMEFAAATGQLEVVKWLHQCQGVANTTPIAKAAEGGHLEVVQWLHQSLDGCCSNVMEAAAANGHLEIMQWLHTNSKDRWNLSFYTSRLYELAACNGHLEVMKWVRDRYGTCGSNYSKLVNDVVSRGHLHILKWMGDIRAYKGAGHAMNDAAADGHLDIVQWLHSNYRKGCTQAAMDDAAGNGHLAVVQWLHDHRREGCTTNAMDFAALNGHLDVMRWLDENRTQGCSWQAIVNAAKNGHVQVVRWLHENFQFLISTAMEAAALAASACKNNLEMIQIFEKHEWFSHPKYLVPVMVNSFETGKIAVVEWLLQMGYQVRQKDREWAAENLKVVKITYRGAEVSVPDVRKAVLQRGNIRMARWLFCHGCNINSEMHVEAYYARINSALLRWRLENGLKLDPSTAWELFSLYGRPEVTEWISEWDCASIISRSLSTNTNDTLWILENVDFSHDSSRLAIRIALENASSDTKLWFEENLRNVESRTWCFASDDDDESERSSKRVRHN